MRGALVAERGDDAAVSRAASSGRQSTTTSTSASSAFLAPASLRSSGGKTRQLDAGRRLKPRLDAKPGRAGLAVDEYLALHDLRPREAPPVKQRDL